MDIRFCYKLTAEAGLSEDMETGEPAECYTEVAFKNALKGPKDYVAMQDSIRKRLALQMGINLEYIIPITTQEYDENAEQEEEV
ncbi:hypothetical protein D3C76_1781860 [compost metagenome]